ncbi:hypothetical protein CQ13_36615 [Bradyrhizobium retamae]|uniref:Uncharacterized protein n=1 Tax=Bradyrhizobium retamae TaxID=1300035 RepID=A0A0R3M8S3_9BRAD|nr:hypothetical protein CQ13_36615 [Bradyrhizobium retamae]
MVIERLHCEQGLDLLMNINQNQTSPSLRWNHDSDLLLGRRRCAHISAKLFCAAQQLDGRLLRTMRAQRFERASDECIANLRLLICDSGH